MVEISNTEVFGVEASMIAGNFAMRTDVRHMDMNKEIEGMTEARIDRSNKLGSFKTGHGHDSFLKGCVVQFNLHYPNYFTPEFQRYSFVDIITSSSKMHRLLSPKLDIKGACNKYVDDYTLRTSNLYKEAYNAIQEHGHTVILDGKEVAGCRVIYNKTTRALIMTCNVTGSDTDVTHETIENIGDTQVLGSVVLTSYECFMKCLSNLPLGFEQTMRCSTNYLQLKTIYQQRKGHKLLEDWGIFCDWILTLPRFKEMCLGE